MKFSICLPTEFEGAMYPIPFAAPEDFVKDRKSNALSGRMADGKQLSQIRRIERRRPGAMVATKMGVPIRRRLKILSRLMAHRLIRSARMNGANGAVQHTGVEKIRLGSLY